jgi:hypothetical protein
MINIRLVESNGLAPYNIYPYDNDKTLQVAPWQRKNTSVGLI